MSKINNMDKISIDSLNKEIRHFNNTNIALSVYALIVSLLFIFYAVLFIIKNNITTSIIMSSLFLGIIGIFIIYFTYKFIKKNKKHEINSISDVVLILDYAYDKDNKNNYVYLKINGIVKYNKTNKVRKDDEFYVIKNKEDDSILHVSLKNDELISEELMKILEIYNDEYINNMLNLQIENKFKNDAKYFGIKNYSISIECRKCKTKYNYYGYKNDCPKCNTYNIPLLKDVVIMKNWYK